MAGAAPHRGLRVRTIEIGRCALASINPGDWQDAYVGQAGTMAAAFVGVLDNAATLASQLDVPVPANGPTPIPKLLVAGFQRYGEDLPARLRGVFAGAITDGVGVYCFRDHVGYRSVFYRSDRRGFYAGSEAKQIVAGAQIPREPDLEVVHRIFFRSLDDDSPCALRGVRRLPKASSVSAGSGEVRVRRYWEPERLLESATLTANDVREGFDALMDQAVSRALTGDDLLSLSGGIDSSGIAAFAAPRHRQLSGRPLHALSVVYPRFPSVDESAYVQRLAEYYDIPLHTYEQTANPHSDIERWVRLVDTPFHSASLSHYEEDYRKARQLGFRTVLTGEHAEFVAALQWYTLDHYLTHGRFRAAWTELSARRAAGRSLTGLARLFGRALAPDGLVAARNKLLRRKALGLPEWVDARKVREGASVSVRERWRSLQLSAFVGPGVSVEAEETCQAVCGVRTRRPWTDVDLWEFFLSLPAEQKFPDLIPKGLVRQLLRGRVPDEILDRRDKTVFDEAALAEVDYRELRRLLSSADYRLAGVNYDILNERLRSENFTIVDYMWASALASVHAFLAQW